MDTKDAEMIDGVLVEPLKQIKDDRGKVMHMLRADSHLFTKFGEVYFSVVNPNVIKAWKRHKKMTQNFAVPVGAIQLVIYDSRQNSPTQGKIAILDIGENNYSLVKIPPMVWYGFKGVSSIPALIVNCSDIPHDPSESEKKPEDDKDIPYEWGK